MGNAPSNSSANDNKKLSTEEQKKLDDQLFEESTKPNIIEMKKLIEKGANIHVRDRDGRNILYWSVYYNNIENVKFLLSLKVDINALKNDNSSVLHIATKQGYLAMVKLLVDNGAKINIETKDINFTPLFNAVINGHNEISKFLLQKGANPLRKEGKALSELTTNEELKAILAEAEKDWAEFGGHKIKNAKKIVTLIEKFELLAKIKDEGPKSQTIRKLVEIEALKLNETFEEGKLSKKEIAHLIEFYGNKSHLQTIKGQKQDVIY